MTAPVLRLDGLGVRIPVGGDRWVGAVDGVTLDIPAGQIVGLVGESGCGKSTLAGAVLGLLPPGSRLAGRVLLRDRDLAGLPEEDYRRLRGNEIALITQDPAASLDPTFPVGAQVAEAILNHRPIGRRAARRQAVELLRLVGIPDAAARYGDPPHRFSGGMTQRAVIAAALANDPAVLIADEPTTALDVTIQAQILYLLRELAGRIGAAVLLITHNLGVVAQVCDRVAVMYAGQVVEENDVRGLFADPRHPYTRALLDSMPAARHSHPATQHTHPTTQHPYPAARRTDPSGVRRADPPSALRADPPAARRVDPPVARRAEPPAARRADLPATRDAELPAARDADLPVTRRVALPAARRGDDPHGDDWLTAWEERLRPDLPVIPGRVPDLTAPPAGCRFAARCAFAHDRCATPPPAVSVPGGQVSCWLHVDGAGR